VVAERRLHITVPHADPTLPAALVALLDVPEDSRFSELERLRRPPTRSTGTAMARALERVEEIAGGRPLQHRAPVPAIAGRVRRAVRTLPALARRRVGQRPLRRSEIDMSWYRQRGARRSTPPDVGRGRGGPRCLRGVRARIAVSGAAPPRRIRQPVAALVRSACSATRRTPLGGNAS
jgi:hypothetical protein